MIGKVSAQKPTALGTLLQAATYGLAIPTIYGTTQTSVLAIWAANLREGSCHGKKKKGKKKKAPPTYVENIDFLIGSNPIEGVLQVWNNATKYPLNFVSQSFSGIFFGGGAHVTITDPYLYAVVAVTWEYHLTGSLLDYGSNGPFDYDFVSEYPLWNATQHGPDLLDPGVTRNYPYVYVWAPGDGGVVDFPFPPEDGSIPGFTGNIKVYYAQVSAANQREAPLLKCCLTFEPVLGDGTEYADAGLSSQQILYPPYAGAGSPNIDLGSAAAIPSIKLETMGAFKRWHPRGDADFADMIEDTIKSGMLQVGSQLGLIQRGVNLNSLPGPVQTSRMASNIGSVFTTLKYYQPNTVGNQLIAVLQHSTSTATISDTAGDIWGTITNSGDGDSVFVATSVGSPARNTVTTDNVNGGLRSLHILELDQGSTVLDNYKVFSGPTPGTITGSIPVTGEPTYVLAIVFAGRGVFPDPPTGWTSVFPDDRTHGVEIYSRIVAKPGVCTFKVSFPVGGSGWRLVLLAYKSAQPVPYPKALGNILDGSSLMNVRAQCQATSLFGSVTMSSQKAASDWLKEFYQCANAAPVWSGFHLKSIAWSEVSTVGNAQIYVSPTSSGPVANLTEDDLIGDQSSPLITVERKAQVDSYNIIQAQFFDRNADYNPSTASEPLNGAIALYGPRKEQPLDLPEIQDPSVARLINTIRANRYSLLRNTYKFTAMAKWAPLEAMDLITITDSKIGINKLPVRLTKVAENDKFELEIEADPFVYGANSPTTLPVTAVAPYTPGDGGDPGSVNTPIIFEPVPRLIAQQNQAQLWFVVSAPSPNYGGCSVLLSTDGGSSYTAIGAIQGNADTGVTVGDWPAANDPDTTNDLAVDLTESLGTLDTYSAADRDNFVPLFYVAGGTTCIPYEIGAYDIATLTFANHYTLPATGGGTNELRRGVFGAPGPTGGIGVDHPDGSRFAFLNPLGFGIFKVNMDPRWIGQTLYFKFLAINQLGQNMQDQADATPYTYVPNGCPAGNQNPNSTAYAITGGALTQPTSTTIAMAQATATSPSSSVNYNARTFTISAPSVPTTYYVTIADPGFLGDTGTMTNLVATAQTSNSLVGVPGNVYIGSIIALPAGGGTGSGSGGVPVSPGSPLTVQYVILDGSTGTNVGPELPAPHAGQINKCKVVTKTSDGAIDLTFKIKQNGVDVFSADPTVAAGTAGGTVSTFTTLTSVPLPVAADDVFTIDITSGSSAWQVTIVLES